jgi:predicted transcriptional regulator
MNNIAKILPTQAFISSIDSGERLTPEQELALDKRCRDRIHGISTKASLKKKDRHVPSIGTEELIARVSQQGTNYFTHHFTPSTIKVLDFIIASSHLKYESAISQQRISDELGVCPKTVYRAVKDLDEHGLIKKLTHGNLVKPGPRGKYIYREQCVYKVALFLFRKDIAFKLHTLLKSLSYKARSFYKCIALSLLFATTKLTYPKHSSLSEYVQVNKRYLFKQGIMPSKSTPSRDNSSNLTPFEPVIDDDDSDLDPEAQVMDEVPVSPVLRSQVTPALHLTKKGQLFLTAFPDTVLLYALDELNKFKRDDRAFNMRLFLNACHQYVKFRHLGNTVNIERSNELIKKYGCKEDSPYFYPQSDAPDPVIVPTVTTYTPKKGNGGSVSTSPEKRIYRPPSSVRRSYNQAPDFSNPLFAEELKRMAQVFTKNDSQ